MTADSGSSEAQAKVLAQCLTREIRLVVAPCLQDRQHVVDKVIQPLRLHREGQNEAVAGIGLDPADDLFGDGLGAAYEGAARTDQLQGNLAQA